MNDLVVQGSKGAHYVYTNTRSCPPGFSKLIEKLSSRAFQRYMTLLYYHYYTHIILYRWKALEWHFTTLTARIVSL